MNCRQRKNSQEGEPSQVTASRQGSIFFPTSTSKVLLSCSANTALFSYVHQELLETFPKVKCNVYQCFALFSRRHSHLALDTLDIQKRFPSHFNAIFLPPTGGQGVSMSVCMFV